jgi:metalloendopeptidase OMA1, mitochondrial
MYQFFTKQQGLQRSSQNLIAILTLSALALSFLPGCTTVPVTGRKQLSLVPESQMVQLGLSDFDQLKKEMPINHDPAINAMVQRVGSQIAQVANKDMPGAKWEFVVFDSKEANAFCLPGGKVGVYTGILPITKDDAGLATVIGHEVAHAVARHGAERMSEALLMQAGGQVLGSATTAYDPRWQQAALLAYGVSTKLGRELPHSRAQELEADHIGIIYMAQAGYDPKSAVLFWQRFMSYNQQQGGNSTPWFLRTHPVDEQRINQLRTFLPEAESVFRTSRPR